VSGSLRTLSQLREDVRDLERQADDTRRRRDQLAVNLLGHGVGTLREVAAAAGLAPSYLDSLVKRASLKEGAVQC
jgi:hypothetical protein